MTVPSRPADDHAQGHGSTGAAAGPVTDSGGARVEHHRIAERRRLDEIFGDVLPQTTEDEREPGEHGGFDLQHYLASRPPHYGR